jgi:hypothetical protein
MTNTDFRAWLRIQADRLDPVGDLARDVAHDRCLSARTVHGVRRHLEQRHFASGDALAALDRAALEYEDRGPQESCPACGKPSRLVALDDRYFHLDGTDNRACWRAIVRGEV